MADQSRHQWPRHTGLYGLSLAAILSALLAFAAQYRMPWSDDAIVYPWAFGKLVSDASGLTTKVKILFASYMGEDHLTPVVNLYGYALFKTGLAPTLAINIATKLEFLIIFASSVFVFHRLWNHPAKTLLFALLLLLSASMTWRNLVWSGVFNLPIIFSIWCFYFLVRYLNFKDAKSLLLFSLFFLLMTLSFETGLATLALLASYTVIYLFMPANTTVAQSAKQIASLGLLMLLLFLPYLIVHHELYGFPIPKSRVSSLPISDSEVAIAEAVSRKLFYVAPSLVFQGLAAFQTFSQWNFDLFRLAYKHVSPLLVPALLLGYLAVFVVVVRRRIYSPQTQVLFFPFCFQVLAIAYTGRHEAGMWTFAGLIYLMMLTDVIGKYFLEIRQIDFRYLFPTVAAAGLTCLIILDPLEHGAKAYAETLKEVSAAYRAVDGDHDSLILLQLPGAREEIRECPGRC